MFISPTKKKFLAPIEGKKGAKPAISPSLSLPTGGVSSIQKGLLEEVELQRAGRIHQPLSRLGI